MFRFANPEYLTALWGVPIILLIFFLYTKYRKRKLELFADKNLHPVLISSYSPVKDWMKIILLSFTFVFLILTAANPQVGTRVEEVKQTGIDVFILLDVSNSMKAEDLKPNRLDKAKFQISNLIRKLRGDRIGLIIFAGDAFVQFPLTTDYSAANLFLSAVSENSIPVQGTAIASAISLAEKSFHYDFNTEKVMIIITDGEDHEGDIMEAVKSAVDKGIKIYTIGLGSSKGAPIPVYNSQGNQTGYRKDREGNIVLTKLDETILKQIAAIANGKYYLGSNYEDHLDLIYKDLSELEKSEFGVKKVTDYESRFYYFLIPAILLLLLEFFINERKSPFIERLNERLGFNKRNNLND
jgi:Ca-activated chloride channel homolog